MADAEKLGLSPADLCAPILRSKPFTANGWLFEPKHDGYRAFVRRAGPEVELLSRNGFPMARSFPEVVVAALAGMPDAVLDAELVVLDSAGRSDYGELQRRSQMRRLKTIADAAVRRPATLIIFDVLQAGDVDLRPLSLAERKAWLRTHVTTHPLLRLSDTVETRGEALFAAIAAQDFEGIVGKRLDSPYKAGRQPSWVKIKNPDYSRKEALASVDEPDGANG
jgi:bifunctional non-homologous end joining protein LigD